MVVTSLSIIVLGHSKLHVYQRIHWYKFDTVVNKTTLLSAGQAFGCEPQQKELHIVYNSMPMAKPIQVSSAVKLLGV